MLTIIAIMAIGINCYYSFGRTTLIAEQNAECLANATRSIKTGIPITYIADEVTETSVITYSITNCMSGTTTPCTKGKIILYEKKLVPDEN